MSWKHRAFILVTINFDKQLQRKRRRQMIHKTSIRNMSAMLLIVMLTALSGCSTMSADGYSAASGDKAQPYKGHDGWRQSSVWH
jgi:hypothetical protein